MGQHDSPSCFGTELRPALISKDDLRSSATARCQAMLMKHHQQELAVVQSLRATAREEVEMGILEDPLTADQVGGTQLLVCYQEIWPGSEIQSPSYR